MGDFLAFRRMVTPVLIQVIFWIGILGVVIYGFQTVGGLESILIIVVGALLVRVWCELLILAFRINETLTDIKNNQQT